MESKRAVIWKAVSSEAQAKDDLQSLTYQENKARDWCTANGYTVTSLLNLPGHSRSESDVITALEELAAEGCYAYHDLRRMWQQHALDVLVVHTVDRLARSRALFMYVVENVIKSGAEIYFMSPGVSFNKNNVDYMAPMALMGLRSSLDAFFEKGNATKAAKLAKGIPVQGKKPFGYIVLYDEKHRPCGVQVDPSKRALLDDAAALVLEGVSMRKLELELFSRFGHNRNGKPFPEKFFYTALYNPWTWGHAAQGHSDNTRPSGQQTHHWLFDSSLPKPDHVVIHWNTHEPLYTGDVAERLKDELRRRHVVVTGTGSARSKLFTGLVICGSCGHLMVHNVESNKKYKYESLRCRTNYRRSRTADCPRKNETVMQWRVQGYIQSVLQEMLDNDSPLLDATAEQDYAGLLKRVRDELETQRRETMNLISRAAVSSSTIVDLYQSQIDERATRIEALETQRVRLEAQMASQHPLAQQQAFDVVKQYRHDFWSLNPAQINQTLHAIFVNLRVVVKDNMVIGRTRV